MGSNQALPAFFANFSLSLAPVSVFLMVVVSSLFLDKVYNPLGPARWLKLVLFLSIILPRRSFWGLNSILLLRMVFMVFELLSLSFGLKIISKAIFNNQGNDEYEIGRWSL
jgi:hypothetical protein